MNQMYYKLFYVANLNVIIFQKMLKFITNLLQIVTKRSKLLKFATKY